MKPLHISLNTAHSGCKPSAFISSFTHSYQVFLPLPAHLTPATTTFLQADTQLSSLVLSTCPNHLNLPRLTTSSTLCTPKRLYKSTLRLLSVSNTPHIHLTIIRSVLSRLCRFAFFIAQVSVPYVNALWTQVLYILPFILHSTNIDYKLKGAILVIKLISCSPTKSFAPKYQSHVCWQFSMNFSQKETTLLQLCFHLFYFLWCAYSREIFQYLPQSRDYDSEMLERGWRFMDDSYQPYLPASRVSCSHLWYNSEFYSSKCGCYRNINPGINLHFFFKLMP